MVSDRSRGSHRSQDSQIEDVNQDPKRIKRRRASLGWDQQTLAKNASVAKSHLSLVERSKANASPEILGRLARAMGCEIADLMPPEPLQNSDRTVRSGLASDSDLAAEAS